MQASEPKDSNPYVAVVAKKHRNLRKKLEKIAKAETQLAQGKVLDEEQKVLLSNKKAIEKSVAELLNIKQQLEEVAKQEEDIAAGTAVAPPAPEVEEEKETTNVETFTEPVEQFVASTMTETAAATTANVQDQLPEYVERLVKAFHVIELYKLLTSKNLPSQVSFFGCTLKGATSVNFEGSVEKPVKAAVAFINASSEICVSNWTYAQLSEHIDALFEEMSNARQQEGPVASLLLTNASSLQSGGASPTPAPAVVAPPAPAPVVEPVAPLVQPQYDQYHDLGFPQSYGFVPGYQPHGAHLGYAAPGYGVYDSHHAYQTFPPSHTVHNSHHSTAASSSAHHQVHVQHSQPVHSQHLHHAQPTHVVHHAPVVAPAVVAAPVPVAVSAAPVMQIAPALPESVASKEEEASEAVAVAVEPQEVVEEEVVGSDAVVVAAAEDEPVSSTAADETAAAVSSTAGASAASGKVLQNVRVRGERNERRAKESAATASSSHGSKKGAAAAHAPAPEKKEPVTFKDRLVTGKATPTPAPAAPVAVAPPLPAVAPTLDDVVAEPAATETAAAEKKPRERRPAKENTNNNTNNRDSPRRKREGGEGKTRGRREEDAAVAVTAEAPKKASFLSVIGATTAPVEALAPTLPATVPVEGDNQKPRRPRPSNNNNSEGRAPRPATSSDKKEVRESSGQVRERREKRESAEVSAPRPQTAAVTADGFQPVQRRTPAAAQGGAQGAADKKPAPRGAPSSSGAGRGGSGRGAAAPSSSAAK